MSDGLLASLGHITSVAAMHVMPDYDTLYQMLQEVRRRGWEEPYL